MFKILDNTFLAAARGDIVCTDIMGVVESCYNVAITSDVKCENEVRHGSLKYPINEEYENLDSYKKLYDMLKRRNVWIGKGELSSLLRSIFMTHDGIDNYLVTDDGKAREFIRGVHNDPDVIKILGFVPEEVKVVGTIGLIVHLKEKGRISQEVCHQIRLDLENSTFRASRNLLELLG